MLGKLLKHEFRATGRIMLPVLGVLLILAGLANISLRGIEHVSNGLVAVILGIFIAAFFIGIVAAGIIALVVMVERFYKNLLKDEGYLTFTLPVNVHGLVWSKLIVSFVWFLVTGIVVILATSLTIANIGNMDLGEVVNTFPPIKLILAELNMLGIGTGSVVLFAVKLVLFIVVSGLCGSLFFYAALALGHCFANNKMLWSVVFFVALGFLSNVLTSVTGIVFSLNNTGGIPMDPSTADVFGMVQSVMLTGLVYELVQGALLYLATTLSLKRGLNLA